MGMPCPSSEELDGSTMSRHTYIIAVGGHPYSMAKTISKEQKQTMIQTHQSLKAAQHWLLEFVELSTLSFTWLRTVSCRQSVVSLVSGNTRPSGYSRIT